MPSPQINDQYWFDYSKGLVDGSVERLETSIESLRTYIISLLGVYSASAIFTIEYKDIENIWTMLLFGLPFIIVLFGNLYATAAKIPPTVQFDYRVPEDIEKAYMESYQVRSTQLKIISTMAAAATITVALTLMLGFILGNKKIVSDRHKLEPYLIGAYDKKESSLQITGTFPPKQVLQVTVVYRAEKDSVLGTVTKKIVNVKEDELHYEISMPAKTKKALVQVEWNDAELIKSIGKEFKIE